MAVQAPVLTAGATGGIICTCGDVIAQVSAEPSKLRRRDPVGRLGRD